MRSWKPSVTRPRASCEFDETSAALMISAALPTARRMRSPSSFSRSTFWAALDRRIWSSIADSELVCLRLVYLGLDEQPQIRQDAVIGFEDDAQLVLPGAVHANLVGAVRVLRRR